MTLSTFNLPKTAVELRASIKTAIEFYQGSPVKNDNKLNEALAVSLGLRNYDQLSPLLNAEQEIAKTEAYPISFDYHGDQQIIINYVRIDTDLVDNGVVSHTVSSREDRISDIRDWIATAQRDPSRRHNVIPMQKDLDTLLASEDEYVLEAIDTNGFIAGDTNPVEFNQICDEMLAAAAAHYQEVVGKPSKTGTRYTDLYTYYGNEEISEIYAGELVLIQERFLSDGELPIGMAVEKFTGTVPEGYLAAYAGAFGEYVPVAGFDDNAS